MRCWTPCAGMRSFTYARSLVCRWLALAHHTRCAANNWVMRNDSSFLHAKKTKPKMGRLQHTLYSIIFYAHCRSICMALYFFHTKSWTMVEKKLPHISGIYRTSLSSSATRPNLPTGISNLLSSSGVHFNASTVSPTWALSVSCMSTRAM